MISLALDLSSRIRSMSVFSCAAASCACNPASAGRVPCNSVLLKSVWNAQAKHRAATAQEMREPCCSSKIAFCLIGTAKTLHGCGASNGLKFTNFRVDHWKPPMWCRHAAGVCSFAVNDAWLGLMAMTACFVTVKILIDSLQFNGALRR